jgi:glycosyltransferase involved in cell wall biosynthesis
MLNLAAAIARRGSPVELLLSTAEGPLLPSVPDEVRVVDLNARRVISSLPRLAMYLRTERPAVLMAAITHANVVAVLAATVAGGHTRVVVSEQNTVSQVARNAARLRDRLMPHAAAWAYRRADAVVVVSRGAAVDLLRTVRVPRGRVRVIPNPVVTREVFDLARAPVADPWFESEGPPVVLALGRLERQKDFETLLRAFGLVRRVRRARLLILGEGDERPRLEAVARELGLGDDILLPGFVPNPYPYIAGASVVALSSSYEGLPGVLVEALALGTPVVATDCPSGPREMLEHGRYGRLVPTGDAQALAEGIASAIDSGGPSLPRDAWERYSLEAVLDDYIDVLLPRSERDNCA